MVQPQRRLYLVLEILLLPVSHHRLPTGTEGEDFIHAQSWLAEAHSAPQKRAFMAVLKHFGKKKILKNRKNKKLQGGGLSCYTDVIER